MTSTTTPFRTEVLPRPDSLVPPMTVDVPVTWAPIPATDAILAGFMDDGSLSPTYGTNIVVTGTAGRAGPKLCDASGDDGDNVCRNVFQLPILAVSCFRLDRRGGRREGITSCCGFFGRRFVVIVVTNIGSVVRLVPVLQRRRQDRRCQVDAAGGKPKENRDISKRAVSRVVNHASNLHSGITHLRITAK